MEVNYTEWPLQPTVSRETKVTRLTRTQMIGGDGKGVNSFTGEPAIWFSSQVNLKQCDGSAAINNAPYRIQQKSIFQFSPISWDVTEEKGKPDLYSDDETLTWFRVQLRGELIDHIMQISPTSIMAATNSPLWNPKRRGRRNGAAFHYIRTEPS